MFRAVILGVGSRVSGVGCRSLRITLHLTRAAPPHQALQASATQAEPKQVEEIVDAVAPGVQLGFADALAVVDVVLTEAEAPVNRLQLDFLGKGHPTIARLDEVEYLAPEYPHTRLRVGYPAEPQHARHVGQYLVPQDVAEAHRLGVAQWKAARRNEIEVIIYQVIDDRSDRVGRVGAVAVGGRDDVAPGAGQSCLICIAVALPRLEYHLSAKLGGDVPRLVGAVVVHYYHLVDERGERFEDRCYPSLLIEAGYNHGHR